MAKPIDTNNTYRDRKKFLIAVDCVIFGFDLEQEKLKLLLFKQKTAPLKAQWSLIGSFIEKDITLEETAKKVLLESTGLDTIFLEELKTYSSVNRDPSERVISVGYFSLIRCNELDNQNADAFDPKWFSLDEIPELILDHRTMVNDAIDRLKERLLRSPIGLNLLDEKFTLPQIQTLYEDIYQKKLDNRNFRKKLLSFNILTKTDKKDKTNSKRGAFLYTFNKESFDKFIAKGFHFEL